MVPAHQEALRWVRLILVISDQVQHVLVVALEAQVLVPMALAGMGDLVVLPVDLAVLPVDLAVLPVALVVPPVVVLTASVAPLVVLPVVLAVPPVVVVVLDLLQA